MSDNLALCLEGSEKELKCYQENKEVRNIESPYFYSTIENDLLISILCLLSNKSSDLLFCPVLPCFLLYSPDVSCSVVYRDVFSSFVLSYFIVLSYFTVFFQLLIRVVISCPVLGYTLSCFVVFCFVLVCPILFLLLLYCNLSCSPSLTYFPLSFVVSSCPVQSYPVKS